MDPFKGTPNYRKLPCHVQFAQASGSGLNKAQSSGFWGLGRC